MTQAPTPRQPTEIINPPKQGTPTSCSACGKNLTPIKTFGDLSSPLCWECHSSFSDDAQKNYKETSMTHPKPQIPTLPHSKPLGLGAVKFSSFARGKSYFAMTSYQGHMFYSMCNFKTMTDAIEYGKRLVARYARLLEATNA